MNSAVPGLSWMAAFGYDGGLGIDKPGRPTIYSHSHSALSILGAGPAAKRSFIASRWFYAVMMLGGRGRRGAACFPADRGLDGCRRHPLPSGHIPIRNVQYCLGCLGGYPPTMESVAVGMLPFLAVMCTYGFSRRWIGFAFGGWRACKKFALIGLAAYAVGSLAGNYTSLINAQAGVPGFTYPRYITWSVIGALAGDLGWFFGKEKNSPDLTRLFRTGNV